MLLLAIYFVASLAVVLAWYAYFGRQNRQRILDVLRHVDDALAGHGRVVSVKWISASRADAQLRLAGHVFQQSNLSVELEPREVPLAWLRSRMRKNEEIVRFEADLDIPPEFNLEIENRRWFARTRRGLNRSSSSNWQMHACMPLLITTRHDWQRGVHGMMDPLVSSREHDFSSVVYRRTSPHFSATLPIAALEPKAGCCVGLFDLLRELAGAASASRF